MKKVDILELKERKKNPILLIRKRKNSIKKKQ